MSKTKPLIVFINDPMGCMDVSADEEYENFKEHISEFLGDRIEIHRAYNLIHGGDSGIPLRASVVVYDFGGMLHGCCDLLSSNSRQILKLAEDNPSVLFIIDSTITYYHQILAEMRDLGLKSEDYPNIVQGKYVLEQIEKWLQL